MRAITFLKRKEIDEQKWNSRIENSISSLPYAYTWYLDAVSENWDALVLNNYEAVMPLVWLRKLGLKCAYQPYFCQQLGVFSNANIDKRTTAEFIRTAQKKFRYLDINLNPSAASVAEDFRFRRKKNLLLYLNQSYQEMRKNYSENLLRNISKANKTGLSFSDDVNFTAFQEFYLENVNRQKENFRIKHETIFQTLSAKLIANKTGKVFAAMYDGKLVACVLLIFHQKRLIGIINSSSATGKRYGASHFVFDRIIEKFSGQDLWLDFEGSSIPSIARFYQGFGAEAETFYHFRSIMGYQSRKKADN